MIKDIWEGVKEIVVELGTGIKESCDSIFVKANATFTHIDVKLMGSYQEIEAYEKELESKK